MGAGWRQKPVPVAIHAVGRLNSWKQIAAYLDTSVRTVQRWEQKEGLPVHRHEHASVATIYAYTSEVDVWLGSRGRQLQPGAGVLAPPESVPAIKRLIVLPFRLLKPDPEIEFLAIGLADAITVALSGLDSLVVRSSLVAARYTGKIDLKRISREAAVDLVLTGTLFRYGGQLRVSAQLVESAGGRVVWSQSAQRGLRDAFQLQDQVVTGIVDSMGSL
jgi:TolB-like protein